MINPSSPITGSAITGLTSPTYTIIEDNPPDTNSKAWVVTALGGTQAGVSVHKNEMPFKVIAKRAARIKTPGARSATTGMYLQGGKNEYSFKFIKGSNVLAAFGGAQYDNILGEVKLSIPAAIGNDSAQLDALFSFMGGFINATLQGLRDTTGNSVL